MKATKVLGPLVLLVVTIWAVLYMSVDPRSLQSFSETRYGDNRGEFYDKRDDRPSPFVQRKNAKTRSGKNMAVTDHNLLESTHEATKLNEINGFSETLGLKALEKPSSSKKLLGDEAVTSKASIEPSKTEQVANMAAIFPTTPPPKKEAHTKIFQQNVAKKFAEPPSGDTHAGKHQVSVGDSSGQGLNSPTNTNNRSDYNVGLGRELPARNPFLRRKATRWETFNRNNSRNMKLTNNTPMTRNALKGNTTTTLNETSRSGYKNSGQNSAHNVVKLDMPKTDQNSDGKDTKIKADNILNTQTKPNWQFDDITQPFKRQCDIDRNCTTEKGRHATHTKGKSKPAHSDRTPYHSDSTKISVKTGDTAVLGEVEGFIDTWEGAERNVSRAVSIIRRGHRLSRGRRQHGAHSPGLLLGAQNPNTDEKEEPTDKTTQAEKRNKDSKRKRRRKQNHDPNRIPHDMAQAKCRCTACLDPVTNKQNYNYACVPVKIKKLVLRRKKKKSGGYRYRDEWEDVAVGCTCVQPRYSP
ncbi:uncharacterized protein [Branchiostoma lanceolatum]|uniref:uncharacterized protein n=1 Tax=Branchiostoma lanceolatum TaxID=7740 RepID=UPI003453CD07